MIKNFILIFFLLLSNWIYSQISYPNAKQYLKEFLAIQALLAENRMDDLSTFFANNNYVGQEDLFMKLNENLDISDEYIIPGIRIRSGGKNDYADNYLEIIFFKQTANGITVSLSIQEVTDIKNIIQSLYETGLPYPMIEAYGNYKKTNHINVEKIDRYKYKIYSDKSPKDIHYIIASNFFNMSAINKNLKNQIAFYGPGKSLYTQITYFEPIDSNIPGKFHYNMHLASVINKHSKSDKFNVDFFMSLNDFNDRIWTDN
jgi:hypothetical protein